MSIDNVIKHLKLDININKEYNQPFSTITQSFSERISVELFGFELDAKKSYSFDTSDNDELKSCEYLQPKICNNCGKVTNYFSHVCDMDKGGCGSKDFKINSGDSRWGIDSESHFKYFDKLNRYILYLIKYDEYQKLIIVYGWFINKNDEHFNYILKNQYNSLKTKNLNFLPFSHDFFLSKPEIFLELEISLENDYKNIKFCDINNPKKYYLKYEHFDYNSRILTSEEIKNILQINENDNKLSKKELLSILFKENKKVDISKFNLTKRIKNLGKNRGITKRLKN